MAKGLIILSACPLSLSGNRDNDNNLALASFRLVARKKDSSGCFRTLEGARDFCAIWSFVSTARKQGHSYWDAMLAAASGRAMELIFPDGVDAALAEQVARSSKPGTGAKAA